MIKEKVIKTIKLYNLIEDGDKIVLGVSGGPDSITMLHLLNQIKNEHIIKFDMVVAHVHHGLRENANWIINKGAQISYGNTIEILKDATIDSKPADITVRAFAIQADIDAATANTEATTWFSNN